MALKLITAASALAVSLADAKLHLRVDASDEDTLITAMITAATGMAQQKTNRAVMPQTWELTLDAFPSAFELTRLPAASVTSLKYVDENGTQQTLGSSLYTLDNASDYSPAYVVPAYATAWPASRGQANAVALRYVAGYADAASVPDDIKSWIKMQVTAMFENRSATDSKQSHALGFADRLLDPYVVYQL